MALYIRVIDGNVTQVWDTLPPAGESGWRDAVEVKPTIQGGRQFYSAHRFDLTTNPAQIIFDVVNISLADRKSQLINSVTREEERLIAGPKSRRSTLLPSTMPADQIAIVRANAAAKIAAISAATTHDELDIAAAM